MSYFTTIRYEYADESNGSPSTSSADPPLYKDEEPGVQHYFLDDGNNSGVSFSSSLIMQLPDDENLPPSSQFNPFGVDDQYQQPFTHKLASSSDYYWQPSEIPDDGRLHQQQLRSREYHVQKQNKQNVDNNFTSQIKHELLEESNQEYHYTLEDGSVAVSNKSAVCPITDELLQQHRTPFRSLENTSVDNTHLNVTINTSFEENKNNTSKWNVGPPAHWKVEELELLPEKRIGRKSFQKDGKGDTDEQGNQIVVVGGDNPDAFDDDPLASLEDSERESGPPVARNGFMKPAYSYSCLIGLSLKNSETGELTVSEIYAFLCHHFPYFREAPSGWKNSVRHNLSLNKCFQKIEVETPGSHGRKSCLWRMNQQKCAKMDQELRKWRDRDEARILSAMEQPENLDSLQNGTMGMPPNMKPRRFSLSINSESKSHRNTLAVSDINNIRQPKHCSKITMPTSERNFTQLPTSCDIGECDCKPHHCQHNADQRQQRKTTPLEREEHQRPESIRAQATRKLEDLLRQKQILEPAIETGANTFGGFTLIGSASGVIKRRSSESTDPNISSNHSSKRQSRPSNGHMSNQNRQFHWSNNGSGICQRGNKDAPSSSQQIQMEGERDAFQQHMEEQNQLHIEGHRRAMAASVLYNQLSCSKPKPSRQLSDVHTERLTANLNQQQQNCLSQRQQHVKSDYSALSLHRQTRQSSSVAAAQHHHASASSYASHRHSLSGQTSQHLVGSLDSCEKALVSNVLDDYSLGLTQSPK